MGEAKRRGSFEQRKAAAIKRNTEKLEKQRLAEISKRQAMMPEERRKRERAGILLATLYGVAMAGKTLERDGCVAGCPECIWGGKFPAKDCCEGYEPLTSQGPDK